MKKIIMKSMVALALLGTAGAALAAQAIGRTVTVYDDGTYRYVDAFYNTRYNTALDTTTYVAVWNTTQMLHFYGRDPEGDVFFCGITNDGSAFYNRAADIVNSAGNGSRLIVKALINDSYCSDVQLHNASYYLD